MRIAYLAYLDSRSRGVNRKIALQMRCWSAAGHEVALFALTPNREWSSDAYGGLTVHAIPRLTLRTLWRGGRAQAGAAASWRPDLVYMRFGGWLPGWGRLARRYAAVAEINSDDIAEVAAKWSWPMIVLHRHTRPCVLRHLRGMVAVTHELAARVDPWPADTTVISNGIDLQSIEPLPPSQADRPALVLIGSAGRPWVGWDRAIELASQHPAWRIHLVGIDRGQLPVPPPDNVTVHGPMQPDAYRPIFQQCDLGIGSMALHRNGMNEACTLKVREYLACGLPVILPYHDTDLSPTRHPFVCQLPNTEDCVTSHREQIETFMRHWRGRRVARESIGFLDAREKEKQRLTFFERICREPRQVVPEHRSPD